jgi:uncharacterized OB-fold protein
VNQHLDKRLPRPTPLTEPWWQACGREELLIQKCADCGHYQFYPRRLCTACGGSDPRWVQATGRGRIRSFTIVRHAVSPAYKPELPYVIALVELEEGPVMMSSLLDTDPESVRSGQAVEVVFEAWTDDITMPKFRILATQEGA